MRSVGDWLREEAEGAGVRLVVGWTEEGAEGRARIQVVVKRAGSGGLALKHTQTQEHSYKEQQEKGKGMHARDGASSMRHPPQLARLKMSGWTTRE